MPPTKAKATHAELHRRAHKRFSEMSQSEREEALVRFGILTKEKRLAPRFGGPSLAKPSKRKSAADRRDASRK